MYNNINPQRHVLCRIPGKDRSLNNRCLRYIYRTPETHLQASIAKKCTIDVPSDIVEKIKQSVGDLLLQFSDISGTRKLVNVFTDKEYQEYQYSEIARIKNENKQTYIKNIGVLLSKYSKHFPKFQEEIEKGTMDTESDFINLMQKVFGENWHGFMPNERMPLIQEFLGIAENEQRNYNALVRKFKGKGIFSDSPIIKRVFETE